MKTTENLMNPFPHQTKAVDMILQRGGSGALFHSPGLGKTWSALMIYEKLKEKNPSLRLLVICPLSLIQHTWIEHVQKIYPTWSYTNLRDSDHYPECDINIINFENLIRKTTLNKIASLISSGDWICVVDESSRMKNHKSLTTKTLIFLRDKFKHRLVMSGTPAPNTELEYWGQMEFIERGSLHPSFFAFRNTYFYLSDPKGREVHGVPSREGMATLFKRGCHYMPIHSRRPILMARIAKFSHYARKEECLPDLPELMEEIREVELSPYEAGVYKTMKRHLVVEIEEQKIASSNALTKLMKLREITSGFIMNEQRDAVSLEKSAKLTELKALIEEVGSEQAIIWCHFKWEIKTIAALLEKEGKTYATLYGETKDRDEEIRLFKAKEAQFLIAHPLSGGHGLTLVNCHIQIYYSISYSYEMAEQSKNRIHRPGQTEKCLSIYLLAKNTIDYDIYDVVSKKKDLSEVLEGYLK